MNTANERLNEVVSELLDTLVPLVERLEITEDELHAAGNYLDRCGQAGMCKSLLDIAFAMTALDTRRRGIPGTRANIEGPLYRADAPVRPDGDFLPPEAELSDDAEIVDIIGTVTDAETSLPMEGVELDFWQVDEHGLYDRDTYGFRGKVISDSNGQYRLHTVLPIDYAEHLNDPIGELLSMMGRESFRAAHIHLKVRVDGEDRLTTQFFRGDSPHLASDYVVGAVSPDLVAMPVPVGHEHSRLLYRMTFDIAVPPHTG